MKGRIKRKRRHQATVPNISGIADIAFFVLIFFLITAAQMPEQGIKTKLPPYTDCSDIGCFFIKKRNRTNIYIAPEGKITVNNKAIPISILRPFLKKFITNPSDLDFFAEAPNRAIIYFYYEKETAYKDYIMVLNEIHGAYHEVWEEVALDRFKYHYEHLNKNEKRSIYNDYPKIITEIDPLYWEL